MLRNFRLPAANPDNRLHFTTLKYNPVNKSSFNKQRPVRDTIMKMVVRAGFTILNCQIRCWICSYAMSKFAFSIHLIRTTDCKSTDISPEFAPNNSEGRFYSFLSLMIVSFPWALINLHFFLVFFTGVSQ